MGRHSEVKEQLEQWHRESLQAACLWFLCLIASIYYVNNFARILTTPVMYRVPLLLVGLLLAWVTTSLTGGMCLATLYWFGDGYFTMGYRG